MATFISNSPDETESFGRQFARTIRPGDVIALIGELGAGKTLFVKGLVSGLGCNAAVTSPTFMLIHEYCGDRFPIFHFDFFRLEDAKEAERLDLDGYFFANGVSVIEWADRFRDLIPEIARWISFEAKSETKRAITTR